MGDSNDRDKQIPGIEARLKKLASEKSKLELALQMMIRLSEANGLDHVIRKGLASIMEVIGATNVILFYRHAGDYRYVDGFDNGGKLESIEDPDILNAFHEKVPITVTSSYDNTKMTFQTPDPRAFTWIYPLLLGARCLAVIKVENTAYSPKGLDRALNLYFSYFAQILKNEFQNSSKLEEVNKQLTRLNQELENRVLQRTQELASANKELKISEDNYRMLVENQTDMVVKVDADGNFLFVSPSYCNVFGKSQEELIGKGFMPLVHVEDQKSTKEAMKSLYTPPHSAYMEQRALTRKGWRWIAWSDTAVIDSLGKVKEIIGVGRDITEQKNAEQALKKSEEKYRSILESMSDAAYITSTDYRVEYMNPKMITQTGRKAVGERCYRVIYNRETVCPWCVLGKIRSEEPIEYELENPMNGRTYSVSNTPVHNNDGSVSKLSLFRDVTEAKLLELQLRQAQKMESIGRLAGGVAHDFNNMLSIILGNTEMIIEDIAPDHPSIHNLNEIRSAARRSSDFVRQLLAFARKQTVSPKMINLNLVLKNMLKMLQRLIGEDVQLSWIPADGLWDIKMDPSQIDQILANLCVNARDAIKGNGKVLIETKNISLNGDKDFMEGSSGDYVMLIFSDNGCGMDKQTLDHVFEPFFTTKDVGHGTGLGLAIIYGIIKQNNGYIKVSSEVEKGTTFKIYFPASKRDTIPMNEKGAQSGHETGKETILLLEDEKAILKMTSMMIERLGYTVFGALTPEKAIEISRRPEVQIDLLITDVVMPSMNGRMVADQILTVHPNLKVLFMSGYTADIIATNGQLDSRLSFIQKPFSKGALGAKIREVLDN